LGSPGPTGPSGTAGPQISNDWSAVYSELTGSSSFVIAASDIHVYFRIDNSSNSITVQLPPATVAGKTVTIIPRASGATHSLTITAPSGSTIQLAPGNSGTSVSGVQQPTQFFSDGVGNWLLTL
jgi:hypothetical protein